MNKTVTINLSGQVFQIDEDAYETLKAYLDSIHARFAGTEGAEEIMADIESRLAEMFAAAMGDKKNVVSMADVDSVMQAMGRPEDFGDVDAEEEPTAGSTSSKQTVTGPKVRKKLYRDADDKIFGGVLSGLSAYLGIGDPVWLRLATATILLFASGGTIILLYIIMWVIVPKAVTASEKLEMKGEPINIDNIERTIREDIEDIKGRFNNMDTHSARERARTGLASIAGVIVSHNFNT